MKHKTSIAAKRFLLPFFMVLLPIFSIAQSSHTFLLPGTMPGNTIVRESQDYYILYVSSTAGAYTFYIIEKPSIGYAYTSFLLPSVMGFKVYDFTIYDDNVYFVGMDINNGQNAVGVFSIQNVLAGNGTVNYFYFPVLPNVTPFDPTGSHQLTFRNFHRIRYFKDGGRGHLMVIGDMEDLINGTNIVTARCIVDCDIWGTQTFEFAFNHIHEEYIDDIIALQDYVVLLARKGGPNNYLSEPIMRLFSRWPFSLFDLSGEWMNIQTNNLCRNEIFATLMSGNNFMTAYHTDISTSPTYEGLSLNTYSANWGTIVPQQSLYLNQGSTISSACEIRGICYDSLDSAAVVLQQMDAPLFTIPQTTVCKFLFQNTPMSTLASYTTGDDLQSLNMINSNLSICSGTISNTLGLTVEKMLADNVAYLCSSLKPFTTTSNMGGSFITQYSPLHIDNGALIPLSFPVTTISSFGIIPCIHW